MSNLTEHPRCDECGASMDMISNFSDHSIYESHCEHAKRMAFYHTGKKVEHCLFCKDSGFHLDPVEGEIVCPYCKGKLI